VRPASESAYAALVRLVREVETQRAPFVRLADRYAIIFLPITAVTAGLAWAISGDPVRALAVFVVATPCPLILAAPIALISGVSRAARAGVIVKGGGVIERLGAVRTALLDKTGTLTLGTAEIQEVVSFDGVEPDELLRLAASVDQLSAHALAEALVHDAERRGGGRASRERRRGAAGPGHRWNRRRATRRRRQRHGSTSGATTVTPTTPHMLLDRGPAGLARCWSGTDALPVYRDG
jgi:cation transport ATPase